jgi:purine catabolism regulator
MTLGEVGVWSEAAPSRDVLVTLEHAATIAALEAVQSRALVTREQRFRSVLLNELVSGHPFDREEMVELATAFGWDLQVPRAAMVVEVARTRPLPIAGQPLEDQVATAARTVLGPTAIVWALRRSAAVLVEAGAGWPAGDVARALQRALQPLVPGATVSITIGRTYGDLAEFHASFREAVQAMALGRDLRRGGFVLSHDELGVYRLLGALPDRVLDGYSTELLGPLIDYDRQHHSSLLDTLEVYLRRDRNMAATARELFVHYNTLRHRLERIEQVTGGIDRHPGGRLGLELALHARRILLSRR